MRPSYSSRVWSGSWALKISLSWPSVIAARIWPKIAITRALPVSAAVRAACANR